MHGGSALKQFVGFFLLCLGFLGTWWAAGLFAQANLGNTANVAVPNLSGTTASIGGGALLAGACATGTVTVTGATTSMQANASPAGGVDPSNGGVLGIAIDARVSSANTVTVSVCSPIAGTPAAATYNVRVIP